MTPEEVATEQKNWLDRIEAAKRRGFFEHDEITLAASWNSCAVAERFNLQRFETSQEAHEAIYEMENWLTVDSLGMDFYYAVRDDSVEDAEEIYKKIQALS